MLISSIFVSVFVIFVSRRAEGKRPPPKWVQWVRIVHFWCNHFISLHHSLRHMLYIAIWSTYLVCLRTFSVLILYIMLLIDWIGGHWLGIEVKHAPHLYSLTYTHAQVCAVSHSANQRSPCYMREEPWRMCHRSYHEGGCCIIHSMFWWRRGEPYILLSPRRKLH